MSMPVIRQRIGDALIRLGRRLGGSPFARGGYVSSGDVVRVRYQHDLPDGRNDHLLTPDGSCSICGTKLVDIAKMKDALNKLNRTARTRH